MSHCKSLKIVVNVNLKNFFTSSMKRAARRIAKGMEVVEYYAMNQWDFDNKIQIAFRERLNDFEEDRYKVNSRGISYQQILTDAALGCRRYVLKTPDHMLPAAFAEMRR